MLYINIIITVIFIGLHLLICFDFPLGEYTLGGVYKKVPKNRKIIHLFFVCYFSCVLVSYILLQFKIEIFFFSKNIQCIFFIINMVFTGIAIILNCFSKSIKEKLLMIPLTVLSTIVSIVYLTV